MSRVFLATLLACSNDTPPDTGAPVDSSAGTEPEECLETPASSCPEGATLCGWIDVTCDSCADDPAYTTLKVWTTTGLEVVCDDCETGMGPDWRNEQVAIIEVAEDGTFDATLPEGSYGIDAYSGRCWVCSEVTVPVRDLVLETETSPMGCGG